MEKNATRTPEKKNHTRAAKRASRRILDHRRKTDPMMTVDPLKMIMPIYEPLHARSSAPAAGPLASDLAHLSASQPAGRTRGDAREREDAVQHADARADLAHVGDLRDAGHDERVERAAAEAERGRDLSSSHAEACITLDNSIVYLEIAVVHGQLPELLNLNEADILRHNDSAP